MDGYICNITTERRTLSFQAIRIPIYNILFGSILQLNSNKQYTIQVNQSYSLIPTNNILQLKLCQPGWGVEFMHVRGRRRRRGFICYRKRTRRRRDGWEEEEEEEGAEE